jgi:inner membrane protein
LSGNDIVITDLRMGMEPEYAFRFKVGEMGNPHAHPAPVERLPGIRDYTGLSWVWSRIWNAQAEK